MSMQGYHLPPCAANQSCSEVHNTPVNQMPFGPGCFCIPGAFLWLCPNCPRHILSKLPGIQVAVDRHPSSGSKVGCTPPLCQTGQPYSSQTISRKLDLRWKGSNSSTDCGSQSLLVSGQQYREIKAYHHHRSLLSQSTCSVAAAAVSVSALILCGPRSYTGSQAQGQQPQIEDHCPSRDARISVNHQIPLAYLSGLRSPQERVVN